MTGAALLASGAHGIGALDARLESESAAPRPVRLELPPPEARGCPWEKHRHERRELRLRLREA